MEQTACQAESRAKARCHDHIADLGNTVECQQTLEVVLCQSHGNTYEHGQHTDHRQHDLNGFGIHNAEDQPGHADDAINACLIYHTGEDHGYGSGGHAVRIGCRCMEGEDVALHTITCQDQT